MVAGIMGQPIREGNYKERNLRETEALIREAAKAGARLVCTFEQFLDGYGFDANKIPNMDDKRIGRYEIIGKIREMRQSVAIDRVILVSVLAVCTTALSSQLEVGDRPRVIVSTDIGGSDPDDFQSMVHYLVYADAFETEGLISSPPQRGRVKDILECIAAYEKDYVNLRTWSRNYPSPDTLCRLARQGAVDPQSGDQPATKISEGAKLLIERAKVEDPRPLYVLVWGSITDVAQAVHREERQGSRPSRFAFHAEEGRYQDG